MAPDVLDAKLHFQNIARRFDDLYDGERRNAFRRFLDDTLRASIYRRFELTFEHLGDLGGRRVLDVGCGGGRYSVMAHQLGAAHVVGVDFAENMIALARDLAASVGADSDRLSFVCGDFTATDFDAPFDCGIAMGVFDYVPDPAAFLRRLVDVVPGRIVASFPVKYDFWAPQRKFRYRVFKRCPLYLYSRSRIESVLAEVGVRSARIERAHRDYFAVIDA